MITKRNDLLVHPVRSRIVGAMAARALTTAQLARLLPDVPVPSLYRHVKTLVDAGILVVADEQRVRGTVERAYTLADGGGRLDPNAGMTAEERLGALTNFTSLVAHSYRTYVEAGGEEPAVANMAALYLTDDEIAALRQSLRELFEPFLHRSPAEGRRRRLISVISQPDVEAEPL